MKNKQWIYEIVLLIVWTTIFVATLIGGNIRVIDYVLIYLELCIVLLRNFSNSYCSNKETKEETEENDNEY